MIDPDAPEPERKKYGLKRVDPLANAPENAPPPPVLSVEESAKLAGVHHDPSQRTAGEKVGDPNDVFALRRELRAREVADDQDRIEIKKKNSRRKRDYWLVMSLVNVVFGGLLVFGILQRNPFMMIYALAGAVILSVGFTWVMWFIMSDY